MAKQKQAQESSPGHSLANPSHLPPFWRKPESSMTGTAEPGDELLQVVVETPRGSRNKYSFDEEARIFRLKAALPAGMVFPYDFGFVPQSVGGDGDPLDVLVLMDEPAFPGCVLVTRLLGVMEAEQTEKDKTERNDRFIAVAETTHLYANLHSLEDIPERALKEIEQFFANYHQLQGRESRLVGWKGAAEARQLVEQGLQLHRSAQKGDRQGKKDAKSGKKKEPRSKKA